MRSTISHLLPATLKKHVANQGVFMKCSKTITSEERGQVVSAPVLSLGIIASIFGTSTAFGAPCTGGDAVAYHRNRPCQCESSTSRHATTKNEEGRPCEFIKRGKRQTQTCAASGPSVCAHPPMPTCPPDKVCIQMMPPARWYENGCTAKKARALIVNDWECQSKEGDRHAPQ
jgi:hypothetical protein